MHAQNVHNYEGSTSSSLGGGGGTHLEPHLHVHVCDNKKLLITYMGKYNILDTIST